jgi:methyl-accepting chemotaxis protein
MFLMRVRIATRLGLGFAIILLLLLMMAGIGYWCLQTVGSSNHTMTEDVLRKQRKVAQWFAATNANGYRSLALFRTTDPAQQKELEEKIRIASGVINGLYKQLGEMHKDKDELDAFNDITAARSAYTEARNVIIKERLSGNVESVNKLIESSFQPALNKYLASFAKLIDLQDDRVDQSTAAIEAQFRFGQMFLLSIAGIAMVLGVVLAVLISRSIIKPLRYAISISKTVAQGDLRSKFVIKGKDEVAELLWSLKSMNESLSLIVGEVRSGSDMVASVSNQIAAGNLSLSARTEQQASALEQTASSTEELTSTVRQNGENAKQANELAASASAVAVKGGKVVSEVVATMGSINESSRKIVDIIGVIDGIAFQTNILALNAAVEAARAGEQGRGFAVVATEVRNLAQRSAAAAKEIKNLIAASVEKVETGARLVDQAGSTMADIVASVGKVTDIIGEITVASQEQLSGIEQISLAIHHMDEMTQENASLVEESLSVSQNMEEHAGALLHVVDTFKIAGESTSSAVSRPASGKQTALPAPTQAGNQAQSEGWEEF